MNIKLVSTLSVIALITLALPLSGYARDHGPFRGVEPIPAFNGAPLTSADNMENLKKFNSPAAVDRIMYPFSPAASAYKGMPLKAEDYMENLKRFNSPYTVERILNSLSPAAAANKGVAMSPDEIKKLPRY